MCVTELQSTFTIKYSSSVSAWEHQGVRMEEKNRRFDSHATYYMQEEVGTSQAERDRGGMAAEQEGDGERSSLGNLFWSSQSADTQGAGKPITV